ncbi:late control protein D [Clostridium saccharoperbutylacetonicum]|uniref:late control protein D n=1 Tax=Clostridium saccharoperbutylacetonicum TaxID=36745 RepID=UPI0039EA7FA8
MGEIHKLRVKSPYELMKIVDIKIENRPNEHGYLYLKCLVDEKMNFDISIKASSEDKIIVYEALKAGNTTNVNEVDEGNSRRLFSGIVQNVRTSNDSGLYYLEIQALTLSIKLDVKKKSRSFQNVDMTYDNLINSVLFEYTGYGFTQYTGKGQKIGKPLFQYKETDWSFLKRIASELKSELYSDIISSNYLFNFGIPTLHSYELKSDTEYSVFKDIKSFNEAGGYDSGYDDTDYFYYEIEKKAEFEIGSEIKYKDKTLYIREYEAYKEKEEILYKYKLCRKNGVWQSIIYNRLLKGAELEGVVLAVQGEELKVHLNIDENQSEADAYWFPYLPPSVNIMYSMPLAGESVRLYFPNESSEAPFVIGCVRKNGDTCEGTIDPASRYFHTEHGSEIAMLPGALNIIGGSEAPLSVTFEDEIGATLTSPNGLSLNAGGEIVISTPNNVNISAQSQVLMTKGSTENGVSIEGEFHVKGSEVILNGNINEGYSPFANGGE